MVQRLLLRPLDGKAVRVENKGRYREIGSVMGDVVDVM